MEITRAMLDEAAARGLLQREQCPALWTFLCGTEAPETPSFKPAHILYYLGGLIAIGAMSLFMNLGWERFGGEGLLLISAAYCLAALLLTEIFLHQRHLIIPAGITAAFAVVMVPLGTYAAQHLMGLWPSDEIEEMAYRDYHRLIDWRWIFMEAATLVAGALALWRYRLPFVMLPVAVTLWYLSMDLTPFLFGGDQVEWYSDRGKIVSVVFGAAMVLAAMAVDFRSRQSRDFPFWLYIFGVITFWGGLTSMDSDSEINKLIYCGINLLMIGVGATLSRRVFAVFGGLGVAIYLGHLSNTIFKDSMLFPLALTAIGLSVIAAGVFWQRHEAAIGQSLRSLLPDSIRSRLEIRAAA